MLLQYYSLALLIVYLHIRCIFIYGLMYDHTGSNKILREDMRVLTDHKCLLGLAVVNGGSPFAVCTRPGSVKVVRWGI